MGGRTLSTFPYDPFLLLFLLLLDVGYICYRCSALLLLLLPLLLSLPFLLTGWVRGRSPVAPRPLLLPIHPPTHLPTLLFFFFLSATAF